MTLSLPPAVTRYFAASGDADIADCFTPDAEVRDEGRTLRGIPAITTWHRDALARYQHSTEPLTAVRDGDALTVTARVSGRFAGSPIVLTYVFALNGERIALLEIG